MDTYNQKHKDVSICFSAIVCGKTQAAGSISEKWEKNDKIFFLLIEFFVQVGYTKIGKNFGIIYTNYLYGGLKYELQCNRKLSKQKNCRTA